MTITQMSPMSLAIENYVLKVGKLKLNYKQFLTFNQLRNMSFTIWLDVFMFIADKVCHFFKSSSDDDDVKK